MPRLRTGYIRKIKIKKDDKTITKLKACWDYVDESGKVRTKSKIVSNKTEANNFIKAKRSTEEKSGVIALEFESNTFGQFADEFKKTNLVPAKYSNGIKVSGYKSLHSKDAQLESLKDFFGHRKINSITPLLIKAYKQKRLETKIKLKDGTEKPRKIASVNRELEMLRHMLNEAKANNKVVSVPSFKGIISTSAEEKRERVLSYEEEEKLLASCELPDKQGRYLRLHLIPIIICGIETAMRRGEILNLEWKDVNLATETISVRAENTKTETARLVPISPRLKKELERMREEQKPLPTNKVFRRKILGRHAGKQVSEPYFVDVKDTFKKSFAAACSDAGISNFRFHDLRHTATTRMILSGIRESIVMRITGHTQIKTFLRYMNPTAESLVSEISKLTAYNKIQSETLTITSEMIS